MRGSWRTGAVFYVEQRCMMKEMIDVVAQSLIAQTRRVKPCTGTRYMFRLRMTQLKQLWPYARHAEQLFNLSSDEMKDIKNKEDRTQRILTIVCKAVNRHYMFNVRVAAENHHFIKDSMAFNVDTVDWVTRAFNPGFRHLARASHWHLNISLSTWWSNFKLRITLLFLSQCFGQLYLYKFF